MFYITGDMHRNFDRLSKLEYGDTLIILGDVGINVYLDERDEYLKEYLNSLGIKLFCVRGNHEERPENISTYKKSVMFNGEVYLEDKYQNLIFAVDGEEYNICNKSVLVMGGAYSIDAEYRIKNNLIWFKDEQLSHDEMVSIYNKVCGKHYDVVLTHTCPYKYEPKEVFKKKIDQFKVDRSMECFFDLIEYSISYDKWYCGHFHTDKCIDNIEFMFKNIKKFNKSMELLKK